MQTVVVLGNGFDLQCGMPTSYRDFMNSSYKDSAPNVWNTIFESAKDNSIMGGDWYDVEGVIEKILTEYETEILLEMFRLGICKAYELVLPSLFFVDGKSRNQDEMLKYNNQFPNSIRGNTQEDSFVSDIATSISELHFQEFKYFSNEMIHIFEEKGLEKFTEYLRESGNARIEQKLLDDLKVFESNFCAYLTSEINYEQSMSVLKEIVPVHSLNYLSIISFNYTTPFPIARNINVINVHGTITQNNSIFGVDNTQLYDKDKLSSISNRILPFTKTFRKIMLPQPPGWHLPNNPDKIVFYGHSLSPADYSYFQSLFDLVDIYNSDVEIEFRYSTYPGCSESDERSVIEGHRVNNLLVTYGASLLNREQGKNLLHKLLLENRLKIKEV